MIMVFHKLSPYISKYLGEPFNLDFFPIVAENLLNSHYDGHKYNSYVLYHWNKFYKAGGWLDPYRKIYVIADERDMDEYIPSYNSEASVRFIRCDKHIVLPSSVVLFTDVTLQAEHREFESISYIEDVFYKDGVKLYWLNEDDSNEVNFYEVADVINLPYTVRNKLKELNNSKNWLDTDKNGVMIYSQEEYTALRDELFNKHSFTQLLYDSSLLALTSIDDVE